MGVRVVIEAKAPVSEVDCLRSKLTEIGTSPPAEAPHPTIDGQSCWYFDQPTQEDELIRAAKKETIVMSTDRYRFI